MRALVLCTALLLTGFASLPAAEAHWDRSSTDPCPPNDIRWWFDHVHRSCCTPSWFCVIAIDIGAAPVLP